MLYRIPIPTLLWRGLCAVLLTALAPAEVPPQSFELLVAGQPPGSPWQSPGLTLTVTDGGAASGEHSLQVPPPAGSSLGEAVVFSLLGPDSPGFVDLWIRPVARTLTLHPPGHSSAGQPVETSGVLYIDGAQFLFQREANRYSVLALDRGFENVPVWLRLGGFSGSPVDYETEDAGGLAKDWLRLTIRRDLSAGTYDVWLNQRLVGADLALVRMPGSAEFRLLHRATQSASDGALAPMFLDDFSAQLLNPLYPDTDSDGMPDAWEAAHLVPVAPNQTLSLDVTTPDRWADLDLDQVPKISEFIFGSRPISPDSDADGLPDGVEIEHGLNPASRSDAALDKDGDGFSNLAEHLGQGNAHISQPPAGPLTNVVYVKADHEGVQNGQYATPYRSLGAALSSPYLTSSGRVVIRGEGGPLLHWAGDWQTLAGNSGLTITKPVQLVGVNGAIVHLQESGSLATVAIAGASATPVFTCESVAFESALGDDGAVFRIVGTPGQVVIRGCRFIGCFTSDDGGALYAHGARLLLEDCWFEGCSAGGEGGAIHVEGGSQATIRRSHFEMNESATQGGGLSLRAATTVPMILESCVFLGNKASRGGALAAVDGADANLLQCTLSSNQASLAGYGGALFGGASSSVFSVSGSIFWNNTAGGAAHSHLSGGLASVTYSTLSGWTTATGPLGTGNNGTDPLFRPGTVMPMSSAMQDSSNPAHNTLPDFHSNARWDAPGGTAGTVADRGAFERQPDSDGDGLPDDWETRYSLNAADAADAQSDADQDGYSNVEEFNDKTDPRNGISSKAPVVFVNPSAGRDWHPGPNPPAGTPSAALLGNRNYPFQTIRRAILACGYGRRIVLLDGTYSGPANTNLRLVENWSWVPHLASTPLVSTLSLDGKTVRGLNGPGRVTLDGGGTTRLFDLALATGTISSSVTLQNISLRRGVADLGGAIRAVGSPGLGQLILQGCVLSANKATVSGGAIHASGATLSLQKCTLAGNDAPRGGAVALVGLTPIGSASFSYASFSECRFAYNLAFSVSGAQGEGGAVSALASSFTTWKSRFDWNQSERQGGAVAILSSSGYYPPSLGAGTVFEANWAFSRGGALYSENACLTTTGSSFVGNRAGVTPGTGDGGALFISHPATNATTVLGYSSRIPQFSGTQFSGNAAGRRGGAVGINDASPLFTNCAFVENIADPQAGRGGAVSIGWEIAQPTRPDLPAFISSPRFVHATFGRNQAAVGGAMDVDLLTNPWLINCLFAEGFPIGNTPALVGPRQLHGCQFPYGHISFTSEESAPSRRNLIASSNHAFDSTHLATPVRIPNDTSSTAGGVEPSTSVVFVRPTSDIDNEARPAAAAGRFTLMRGCDEPRDSDADTLPDWFELLAAQFSLLDAVTGITHTHPLNPALPTLPSANPTNNADADAYTLSQELHNAGRPDVAENQFVGRDSDNDGLSDLFERMTTGFDWRNSDQNADGVLDGWAIRFFNTIHFNPDADADNDGITNKQEADLGTNPNSRDSDGDGVPDAWEIATGGNPNDRDSDDDGRPDQWAPLPTDSTGTTVAGLHQPTAAEPWYVEHAWSYMQYDPGSYFFPVDPNLMGWSIDTLNQEHDFVLQPARLVPMGSNAPLTEWCHYLPNLIGPRSSFKSAREITLPLDDVTEVHRSHAYPIFIPMTDEFEALPASLTSLIGQNRDLTWAEKWFQEAAAAHSDGFNLRTVGRARQRWLPHNQHHTIQHSIYRMVPSFRLRSTHPEGSPGDVSLTFIRVRGRAAAKYTILNALDLPHPTYSLEDNNVTFEPVTLTLSRGQTIGKMVTLDPFQSSKLSTSNPLIPIGYPITEYFDLIEFHALLPFDIIAHKRGTLNNPGPRVPKGFGPYGQEVTLLANGDYESAADSEDPDYASDGNMTQFRLEKDNDLAKIRIRWPIGLSTVPFKMSLKSRGLFVSYTDPKNGPDIQEPDTTDLKFFLKNGHILNYDGTPDANILSLNEGILESVIKEGGIDIFTEGGEYFGVFNPLLGERSGEYNSDILEDAEEIASSATGAVIELDLQYGGEHQSQKVTVYKGGFWRFVIPENKPPLPLNGILGTLEFRDGRGRLENEKIDLGNLVRTFRARSGVTNGKAPSVVKGKGHVPEGWYLTYKRTDFSGRQRDLTEQKKGQDMIYQGGYVRWKQDDMSNSELRYTKDFEYNGTLKHDRSVGYPNRIMFKWQLHPIPPNKAYRRTQLQIHPDGRKNGTLGCIGIQSYADCVKVSEMLNNYYQCNLLVYIQPKKEK